MTRKYELIPSDIDGLYRIKALKSFGDVKKGDIGGYVAGEHNLSQFGDCWIYDNAEVFGNARVYGNAEVFGSAEVCGNAEVSGNVKVSGRVDIYGDVKLAGNSTIENTPDGWLDIYDLKTALPYLTEIERLLYE